MLRVLLTLSFCCDMWMMGSVRRKDPSCLASTVQSTDDCVIVRRIFSWSVLGALGPAEYFP